ncbi:PAS domain S-box protein [Negadavirga shengliensis]|uniref:histidine kinase n=1 Tax=Negadavirga shengliensis TaxID=1389218 RepID=A0ABV9SWW8_9BACT
MPPKEKVNNNQKIKVLRAELKEVQKKLDEQKYLIQNNSAIIQAALNQSNKACIFVDPHLNITEYNTLAKSLFSNFKGSGISAAKKILHLLPEDESRDFLNEIKEAFSGKPIKKEKSFRQTDGSRQNFSVTYIPVSAHPDHVSAVIITFSPLKILEQGSTISLIHSLNERIKEQSCLIKMVELCNTATDIKELLSNAVNIIPEGWQFPEITSAVIRFEGKVFTSVGHKSSPWFQRSEKKTSSNKKMEVSVFYQKQMPVADDGPFLKEEAQLIRDISNNLVSSIDQIIAREKIRQKEQYLFTILNSDPQCVKLVASDGTLLDMNPAGLHMIEAQDQPEAAIGNKIHKLIHPEDLPIFTGLHENALKGKKGEAQFRIIGLKGTQRWMENTSVPFKDNRGKITSVMSVAHDITDKKNLQQLLDNASQMARIGGWELDMVNNTIFWSKITREIHEVEDGFEPDLESGINFYRSDYRSKVRKAIQDCADHGIPFDFEFPIVTGKGREKWVRAIGQGDFRNGKCVKIFGSFQDIHRTKSSELALEKAYEEKKTILESIGDAFFAVDENWTVTYWNKEAETLLDMDRNNILGKNLWTIYRDAVELDFYAQYHKAMDTGKSVAFEEYYPTVNKWFEVNAYPSEKGLSVYFKDISLRKLSEQAIKATNERFEKVTEATNDAIWDWDIVQNTIYWGNGFKTLFGYDVDKKTASSVSWTTYIHEEDVAAVKASLSKVIEDKSRSNWEHEYRYIRANGEHAFVVNRGVIIRDDKGKAIRMVGAMTDITHRKEYEASLKKLNEKLEQRAMELAISNEDLEQFAFVASHDLQEPLRMITSFLALLKQNYSDQLNDNAQKYIYFAVDGAQRMRQIILDLLEFSRVGKQKDKIQPVDLNLILEETCHIQKGLIEEKNAVISYQNLPKLNSYRAPLLQIFQNLIGNALKYSQKGIPPQITVTARDMDGEWQIAVQDNGIGIEKEYFNKIFVIFQRLHGKDEYEGTGIGLAIVKKIVENMKGRIWVASELGRGSTFYFTLKKIPFK